LLFVSNLRHDDPRCDYGKFERVPVTVRECVALSGCCGTVDLDGAVTHAAGDDRMER
jgi:hypothetical protein